MSTTTCGWCAEEILSDAVTCPHCQGDVAQGQRHRSELARERSDAVKSKAPAGWYDDPKMVNTRRYWDGQKWTEHRQEKLAKDPPPPPHARAVPPTATSPTAKDETSFAWAIALLPIVQIPLLIYRPGVTDQWPFWIGYWVVTIVLAVIDTRVMRSRGLPAETAALSALVPFYLIGRTRKAGSTAAIPIVWFATFGASLLTGFLAPAHYDYDSKVIEQDLASQYGERLGHDVTVSCPSAHNVKAGDKIHCSLDDGRGNQLLVVVEFNDDDGGSYTFHAE